MASITPNQQTYLIPLNWTLLATDSDTNNIASFPNGAGDGNGKYLSTATGTYGVPSGGNVGITISGELELPFVTLVQLPCACILKPLILATPALHTSGQEFYPFWNNNGLNDAAQCNLDSCQEHGECVDSSLMSSGGRLTALAQRAT